MKRRKNGQVVVTDLFLAIAVYVIIMITIIYLYASYSNRLNDEVYYRDMMLKAFELSDNLLKHEGSPTDWNNTNVKVIGLAESDRVLSSGKLQNFVNISYNFSKHILGLGSYEYFVQIRDTFNRNLMEAGNSPREDEICNETYQSVTLRRFALWEGQKVIVYITVWDDDCQRSTGQGLIRFGQPETYIGTPEEAYEEDGNPSWSTQLQQEGDLQYASASDEGIIKPDYVHFNFPTLNIPSSARIDNVTFKVVHREDPAGGYFPTDQEYRSMIRCWNGIWYDMGNYSISPNPGYWLTHEVDISDCVDTVSLANNIHIIMTYDPAFDAGGTQDIDLAEVTVNTR